MQKNNENVGSLLSLITSMLIFGTIGIFVKFIPLPSEIVAMTRGFIGGACLLVFGLIRKQKFDFSGLFNGGALVFISGGAIGFNWILLFESYKYTSVATATLGYYMAPVFVILFSPLFLKEKLTAKKLICVTLAVLGMFFVSGVLSGKIPDKNEIKGIVLSLGAASFYASIIILNKKTTHIPTNTRTLLQLFSAAVVLVPYSFITKGFSNVSLTFKTVLLLLIVGIIHTGFAYFLYFGCMKKLKGGTVAIFSYIDPVSAIILSALILPDESLTLNGIIGAVLILSSAFLSEFDLKEKFFKKS